MGRFPALPGGPYHFSAEGVALDLPADWYVAEGLAEGVLFDVRLFTFGVSPYFWTAALDKPSYGIEVRNASGAALLTSRDAGPAGPELNVTITYDAACAPEPFKKCAFFDSGATDQWVSDHLQLAVQTGSNVTCTTQHLTDFVVFAPPRPSPSPSPPVPSPGLGPSPSLGPGPSGWWQPRVWATILICWGAYVLLQGAALRWEVAHPLPPVPPRLGFWKALLAHHVLLGIPLPATGLAPQQRAAAFFSSFMAVLALCAAAGAAVPLMWVWSGLVAGALACPIELAVSALFLISRRAAAPEQLQQLHGDRLQRPPQGMQSPVQPGTPVHAPSSPLHQSQSFHLAPLGEGSFRLQSPTAAESLTIGRVARDGPSAQPGKPANPLYGKVAPPPPAPLPWSLATALVSALPNDRWSSSRMSHWSNRLVAP